MQSEFITPPGFGDGQRASYAVDPAQSRGRRLHEAESRTRTPFQRDRDRIVHSEAFRRLQHKTQVFVVHEGDHFRTRLTHTIEVSQIARALARAFHLDEDLTEAHALAHDFGHTPFGHAGERALNDCMVDYGGFDHNAQTLRIVTRLEQRYSQFDGLNLTWETLEGLVKHNGPLMTGTSRLEDLPLAFRDYDGLEKLQLDTWPSLEAQCAAIADDIAYDNHDIDDGLRAGLFTLEDLRKNPLSAGILQEVSLSCGQLSAAQTTHELIRRQITAMVEDVISHTQIQLETFNPHSADDVRNAGQAIVAFSPAMATQEKQTKRFLFQHMYRHNSVTQVMDRA